MSAKAKRKKNTTYSTHEYRVTLYNPTGILIETDPIVVIGSREAFHQQLDMEREFYLVTVFNVTLEKEEYRSPELKKGLQKNLEVV
jgi:hypothetical protein